MIFDEAPIRTHAVKIQLTVPGELGRHVKKVSSAVEIIHAPSGTTATSIDSRSQHTNRGLALLRLVEKLEQRRTEAAQARKADLSKRRRQPARCSATRATAGR